MDKQLGRCNTLVIGRTKNAQKSLEFQNNCFLLVLKYSLIECYWSDEMLIINEDIRHIKSSNILIFFEIIDFLVDPNTIEQYGRWKCILHLSTRSTYAVRNFNQVLHIVSFIRNAAKSGWYTICWAFLKTSAGQNVSSIDKKCQLQLHYYQRNRNKFNIWDEWRSQKRM